MQCDEPVDLPSTPSPSRLCSSSTISSLRNMFQSWKESNLLDEEETARLQAYIDHRAHVEQRREDYKKQRESLQPLQVSLVLTITL